MRDTAPRTYTVVGERFAAFKDMPGVLLVSELQAMLAGGDGPAAAAPSIVLGQGLDGAAVHTLGVQCQARGLTTQPPPCLGVSLAGEEEVHKTRAANVLITRPRRTGPGTFDAALLVNSDNELMLDHYSAMHLPAMVLVEAARQMLLAVTEMYYIDPPGTPHRFLINAIQCDFHLQVFPLPVTVRYEVRHHQAKKAQLHVDAAVSIIQAGRPCVTLRIGFSAVDLRVAKKHERVAALAMLKAWSDAGCE